MRGSIRALSNNQIEAYNRALFTVAWADGKDLSDRDVVADILDDAGIDSAAVADAMADWQSLRLSPAGNAKTLLAPVWAAQIVASAPGRSQKP